MSIDSDATGDGIRRPAHVTANLFLPETDAARVCDHGDFATLRLGDEDSFLSVFATGSGSARELADAATVWAELAEARDRGEDVELWGGWVLSADTFRGPR
jgi:hypothetical protein